MPPRYSRQHGEISEDLAYGELRSSTVILIAHRLSTVVDCDRIEVLADGHIVEAGSHQDLMEGDGADACLWTAQHVLRRHGLRAVSEELADEPTVTAASIGVMTYGE